ncbi:ribosome hibernation protein YhbH [Ichthyobacterium seriolicida]|uniref:Ribosome hibernation protein YhbH n=1 Tax=Ichthyobacterium seriolicida TaxID=242600 RepID=A0A1J1ECT7_9FLAO|nr:ribosome hibernation protein YhbH [Ichthyobacterium seriolicida]
MNKKVKKLELFYDKIVSTDVYLKLGNSKDKGNKIVEMKVYVPKNNFVVKKSCRSFEEAIDSAVDSLSRLLKRYNQSKMKSGRNGTNPLLEVEESV